MTSVSSVGFQDFGDFGGGNFASYLAALNNGTPPPPPPPNTTQANNPTTMTAAELREWQVNQIWAQHFPEIEVFPPGLIVYTADETIYMHFRPEFAAQVEALDLAAYSRSIVKQYGVLWEEYHVRVLAERQSQMLVSGAREEGYNAQGDYGFSLEYSGGNWGRNSGGVFAAADRAYRDSGAWADPNANSQTYDNFVNAYVQSQVRPTSSFDVAHDSATGFWVQVGPAFDSEPNDDILEVRIPRVWVPHGDGSRTGEDYWSEGGRWWRQSNNQPSIISGGVIAAPESLWLGQIDGIQNGKKPLEIAKSFAENLRYESAPGATGFAQEYGGAIFRRGDGKLFKSATFIGPKTGSGGLGSVTIPISRILSANPSMQLVAVWHTHTLGSPFPSPTDNITPNRLFENYPSFLGMVIATTGPTPSLTFTRPEP
jgi:hypothetical protein